jgi:hypothetical protein
MPERICTKLKVLYEVEYMNSLLRNSVRNFAHLVESWTRARGLNKTYYYGKSPLCSTC